MGRHWADYAQTFARRYNGPANVDDYSGKLNRAMKVIGSLQQDGAKFQVLNCYDDGREMRRSTTHSLKMASL